MKGCERQRNACEKETDLDITTHGYTLQHAATQCNMSQHATTCYNMLQHATKYRNIMQPMGARSQLKLAYVDLELRLDNTLATHCNTLQHTATHCNTLQHTATHSITHCSMLQHVAACNTQYYTATCCNMLQHAATCCNMLQHAATDTWQIWIEAFICTPWASAASCTDNTLRYTATL